MPAANPPSRKTAYRHDTRDDDGDDESELLSSLGTLVKMYATTRGRPQIPLVEQLRQLLDRFTRSDATRRVHFRDDNEIQTPVSDDENAKSPGKGAKTHARGKGKSIVQHDDSKTNLVRKGDTPQHDTASSRYKGKKTAQQPHDTPNQGKGKSALQQFTSSNAPETVERTQAHRPPKIVDDMSQQICSYHKLCNALNEGKLPADCCGAMVKTENIGELRALSKIHELQSKTFALVLWDSADPDCAKPNDAINRWFITEQGAVDLYSVPLGLKLPEVQISRRSQRSLLKKPNSMKPFVLQSDKNTSHLNGNKHAKTLRNGSFVMDSFLRTLRFEHMVGKNSKLMAKPCSLGMAKPKQVISLRHCNSPARAESSVSHSLW